MDFNIKTGVPWILIVIYVLRIEVYYVDYIGGLDATLLYEHDNTGVRREILGVLFSVVIVNVGQEDVNTAVLL